jgi:hypothetical protein
MTSKNSLQLKESEKHKSDKTICAGLPWLDYCILYAVGLDLGRFFLSKTWFEDSDHKEW